MQRQRLWLDATADESDIEDTMDGEPSVPPVPQASPVPPVSAPSVQPTTASSRRRRSLPSPTGERPKKRSANYVRPRPASPEVISSLIESLAAISISANQHIDNLLGPAYGGRDIPGSAPAWQTAFSYNDGLGVHRRGVGSEYGAYGRPSQDNQHLELEDAAEPPTVPRFRPPLGLSPVAWSKKDHVGSLKNYIKSGLGSTTSLHSYRGRDDDVRSMGSISIEPGVPRQSTTSRGSFDSRSSARGHNSLTNVGSRERLKSKENERRRATLNIATVSDSASSSRSNVQLSSPKSPKHPPRVPPLIREESSTAGPSRSNEVAKDTESPIRAGKRPVVVKESDSPVVARELVPQRKSSLRHQDSPSGKKAHSRRSSQQGSTKTETVPEESTPSASRGPSIDELGDTEVTKRIRELKAQKELRDREARQGSVDSSGRSPKRLADFPRSKLAHSRSSSTSGTSVEYGVVRVSKAHRVLGISTSPTRVRTARAPDPAAGDGTSAHRSKRLQVDRSATPVNDDSSLPVDYSFVIQRLDRVSTPDNIASKKASSSTPLKRPQSLTVGPRSTSSRQGTKSISNDVSLSNKFRGADKAPTQHISDQLSASRQSSLGQLHSEQSSLRRSSSERKKRWSHPDLPLAVDWKPNKRSSDAYAVRQPQPSTVIEERPSTAASVDDDVYAFLRAPRLSQKIRHPQSGRTISFSEVGDPKGYPVFCCVGMGLTRYVTAFYDELAVTLKLRLITPDRPGVGGSQADPSGTPLSWPDDVLVICEALGVKKFSIIGHSAGAIYALATALRMPQNIRGHVHLLAPWIPPSQMSSMGLQHKTSEPERQLPKSQRFLRVLPTAFLRIANYSFMSTTSASVSPNGSAKPPKPPKRKHADRHSPSPARPAPLARPESIMLMDQQALPNGSALSLARPRSANAAAAHAAHHAGGAPPSRAAQERRRLYDARLTFAIWDLATAHSNPSVDLVVCLERGREIGFRYVDITRGVVIHHGSRDTRVPVENVKWLGRMMRKCEVRILEGEGHGLMASAGVMGNVLMEVAEEWEEWRRSGKGEERDRGRGRG